MTELGERDLTYATYLTTTIMLIAFIGGFRITQTEFFGIFGWIIMAVSGDVTISMLYNFYRKKPASERTMFETVALGISGGAGLFMYLWVSTIDGTLSSDPHSALVIAAALWSVAAGYSAWILEQNAQPIDKNPKKKIEKQPHRMIS